MPPNAAVLGEGLLSGRQITLPLTIAVLLTGALYLTFLHFYVPGEQHSLSYRYFGNGYCQSILFTFLVGTWYALLQGLGLGVERYHLTLFHGIEARPPRGYSMACFLSGRRESGEDGFFRAARRWYGRARTESTLSRLSEHLLLLRGQQHQHNLAPLLFVVWVLPLLGFIGTVIGIGQAIGGLEQTIDASGGMRGGGLADVLGGLSFAFDTTFLGLVLVIPTMLYAMPLRAQAEKLDLRYQELLLDRLLATPEGADNTP